MTDILLVANSARQPLAGTDPFAGFADATAIGAGAHNTTKVQRSLDVAGSSKILGHMEECLWTDEPHFHAQQSQGC